MSDTAEGSKTGMKITAGGSRRPLKVGPPKQDETTIRLHNGGRCCETCRSHVSPHQDCWIR